MESLKSPWRHLRKTLSVLGIELATSAKDHVTLQEEHFPLHHETIYIYGALTHYMSILIL
jgi:hypothetical protein